MVGMIVDVDTMETLLQEIWNDPAILIPKSLIFA